MNAWILIVSLYTTNGVALLAVPGFLSEEACNKAAVATAQKFSGGPFAVTATRTLCVASL